VCSHGTFGKKKSQNLLGLMILKKLVTLNAGDVIVTPDGGQAVKMGKGDLVTFPAGMSCMW
jgi:uncharacterized protein YjlB